MLVVSSLLILLMNSVLRAQLGTEGFLQELLLFELAVSRKTGVGVFSVTCISITAETHMILFSVVSLFVTILLPSSAFLLSQKGPTQADLTCK